MLDEMPDFVADFIFNFRNSENPSTMLQYSRDIYDFLRFMVNNLPDFDGKEIKPFWICNSEKEEKKENEPAKKIECPISAEEFAKLAVEKIVDCCTYDKNGKTRLQVYEKKRKKLS